MKKWTKFLALLVVLALASSQLFSADLHWLFWDRASKEATEALEQKKEISEQESMTLETKSSEKAQTEPGEPLKSSEGEISSLEATGFEDATDEEVIAAAIDAVEDMEFAAEIKDEGYVVVSAQYDAKVADFAKLQSENNELKKSLDPFKFIVLPEALFSFGEHPWGVGLTLGMAYDNFMVSLGVDKRNIDSWECLANPEGYTMRMGLGLIF